MVAEETPESTAPAAGTATSPAPAAEPATSAAPEAHRTVDLTLGAWRPREAATQLAAVAGIALGPGLSPDAATSPVTVGRRGIDTAAVGDPIAVLAHDDAARIAAALPAAATIVVLAPRHGRGLGTLNDWLFFYLRRLALSLVVVGDEPATAMARSAFERRRGVDAPPVGKPIGDFPAEQQRLLHFFPGLLPKAIAERCALDPSAAALIPAGPAHFLIPPGYRDVDPATAAPALDAMEALEVLDDGFKALAETFCTAHFADGERLSALASRAFHSGEIDLARELAARARNVARTPAAAATADLVRQELRLYQRRFTEIFATPEPSPRAPEQLRAALASARLRAALERGERTGAPAGLDAVISKLEAGKADPDDLHLLSLHVAARIAAGEGDGVKALAEMADAAAGQAGDERLVFACAMSLAALARRSGDRAAEQRALTRGFATSAGARSLGEIVAMNVALARTEEDPVSPAAQGAWLRAALAWLAFEPVEALPVTAVEAVLGTVSVPRVQLDQSVSEAIAAALQRAIPGLAAPDEKDAPLPSIRLSGNGGIVPTRATGGPGAAVLWSARKAEGQPPSPPRLALLALAWTALRQLCPAAETSESGTILVDDNSGLDLPSTRNAALSMALRAGVAEVCFGEERIALDAATRPRLAADLRVGLSPAIAAIDAQPAVGGAAGASRDAAGSSAVTAPAGALRARFRRHLDDTTLSGREAEILAPIRDRGRMPLGSLAVLLGMPLTEAERLLSGLEARRIVRVDFEGR